MKGDGDVERDGGMWSGDGRMWGGDGRMWGGDGRMWGGDGRMWSGDGRMWGGDGGEGFAKGESLTTENTESTETRSCGGRESWKGEGREEGRRDPPQCAASRGIGYLAQPGRTRRKFLGQPTVALDTSYVDDTGTRFRPSTTGKPCTKLDRRTTGADQQQQQKHDCG